ncbi:MAG: hypothetical protein NTW80_06005, partial [Deltaproteobacteria bacterium]|nr:hypothetical protein [Deltaproteobacteria bacterium]
MRQRRIIGLVVLAALLGLLPLPARAIERGYPAYANGAQTFFSGYLPPPPPGLYISYSSFNYQANKFQGLPGFLGFHMEAVGNTLGFTYVGKFKILGADYAASAAVPLVYLGERIDPNLTLNDPKLATLVRIIKNPPQLGNRLTPEQKVKLAIFFQTPPGKLVQAQIQQRVAALKDAFGGKILKIKDV